VRLSAKRQHRRWRVQSWIGIDNYHGSAASVATVCQTAASILRGDRNPARAPVGASCALVWEGACIDHNRGRRQPAPPVDCSMPRSLVCCLAIVDSFTRVGITPDSDREPDQKAPPSSQENVCEGSSLPGPVAAECEPADQGDQADSQASSEGASPSRPHPSNAALTWARNSSRSLQTY
jgi:hypothetical protein